MTQPGHQPSKDWLAFVKTSRARNKIKHVINASEREKAIEIGQKYLEKEARRLGVALSRVSARPIWSVSPPSTATARWRTCTRRWATASSPRGRCCRSSRPDQVPDEGSCRAAARTRAEAATAMPRARRQAGKERRPRHHGQGHRRPAGLSRQVLQSDPRRVDRRLRDARQGRRRAFDAIAPTCRT